MFAKHIPLIFLILPQELEQCPFESVEEFNHHCIYNKLDQNSRNLHNFLTANPYPNPERSDNRIFLTQESYEFVLTLDTVKDFHNYVRDIGTPYSEYVLLEIACDLEDIEMYEYLIEICEFPSKFFIEHASKICHNDALLESFIQKVALGYQTCYPFMSMFIKQLQRKAKHNFINNFCAQLDPNQHIVKVLIETILETDDDILLPIIDFFDMHNTEELINDFDIIVGKITISQQNFVELMHKSFDAKLIPKIGNALILHKRFDLTDVLIEMGHEMIHRTICIKLLNGSRYDIVSAFMEHYKHIWQPIYPDPELLIAILTCTSFDNGLIDIQKLNLIEMGILDLDAVEFKLCVKNLMRICQFDVNVFRTKFHDLFEIGSAAELEKLCLEIITEVEIAKSQNKLAELMCNLKSYLDN
jgi:hypothetical protein